VIKVFLSITLPAYDSRPPKAEEREGSRDTKPLPCLLPSALSISVDAGVIALVTIQIERVLWGHCGRDAEAGEELHGSLEAVAGSFRREIGGDASLFEWAGNVGELVTGVRIPLAFHRCTYPVQVFPVMRS
jgi:hypothetical protein